MLDIEAGDGVAVGHDVVGHITMGGIAPNEVAVNGTAAGGAATFNAGGGARDEACCAIHLDQIAAMSDGAVYVTVPTVTEECTRWYASVISAIRS